MIDEISSEIIAKRNTISTTIVSICGAADLGKSYMSQSIAGELLRKHFTCNHLTLDAYLMPRATRLAKGLSGYDLESYNLQKVVDDLSDLKEGKSIQYRSYDHLSGMPSAELRTMDPSDVLIFDGLHSMHPYFSSLVDLSLFIYTQDDLLKEMRKEADITKRNYTVELSNEMADKEFNLYREKIAPYGNSADYLICLKAKWKYELTIVGNAMD